MAIDPAASAELSFDDACRHVVAHLKEHVPFACWSVSRIDPAGGDGGNQTHLYLDDDVYGMRPGDTQPWTTTFCQYMVAGRTPSVAPDAMSVPLYADVAARAGLQVGAYAGVPIRDAHGDLFGTLCGFDPDIHDDDLLRHGPLLELMAGLLGRIVHVEKARDEAVDRAEDLRWAALHDPLTGLAGRAAFLDLLARAAQRNATVGDGARPALVLLGVGDLAAVNATLGHATGDRLLVEVAARLAAALHPFDTVARLDGAEFAILLHDSADVDDTAAHVQDALREPIPIGDTAVAVSTTAGVAVVDGTGPDVLLTRARTARQASAGRPDARWVVHEPTMTLRGPGVPTLRAPLREAIRSGAVRAAYQPIVRLDDGGVVAYEALARWSHDGVAIPPDVFVPLAARSGLLADLTDHMIELAAGRLVGWSDDLGHRRLQVGVNVPPGLLLDPTFPERVEDAVRRHGLARYQLVLEITEDALLDDLVTARAVAHRLDDLGVALSLDDVGSGYASLLHLRHLPLRTAKIDRAFVDDVDTSEESRHFLRAVLTCGRDLGLGVIVEGVERASQAEVLRSLGATHAQGHHFGRPTDPAGIDVRTGTVRRSAGGEHRPRPVG